MTQATTNHRLTRLITDLLGALAARHEWDRWIRARLRLHRILGRPPEPEYQILHILHAAGSPYYQKALADQVLRGGAARNRPKSRVAYIYALDGLWEIGFIRGHPNDSMWQHGSELRITPAGARQVRAWHRLTRGHPWVELDRRRRNQVRHLFGRFKARTR